MIAVGSPYLRIHQDRKLDFDAQLTIVYMVKGMGYKLFSLHDLQRRHIITLDHQEVHMFDRRLTIPRDEHNSSVYATRLQPTSSFTAVPVTPGQFPHPGHALPYRQDGPRVKWRRKHDQNRGLDRSPLPRAAAAAAGRHGVTRS